MSQDNNTICLNQNDDEWEKTLKECLRKEREIEDAYNKSLMKKYIESLDSQKLKNEEKNDEASISEEELIEQKTYKGVYYDDSMDMEKAIREDKKK